MNIINMAADSETVEVVRPKIENLTEVETNLTCPEDGCNKVLSNTSALRMHLEKTHKTTSHLKENEVFEKSIASRNKVKKKVVYCCPIDGCVRGESSGRYFNRLAHVKQHYMNVHGEKKFICKKCKKKFGRNDVCLRHEKICGMVFPCSCGVKFNSQTSMLTHARRNGHVVSFCGFNKRSQRNFNQAIRKQTNTNVESQTVCVSFLPVLGKGVSNPVRPLKPKIIFSDAETQTASMQSVMQNDEAKQKHVAVAADIQLERPVKDALCKHTQTAEESYLPVGFLTDEAFDVDFAIDHEDLKELAHSQTQTSWGLAFDNFPLFEDNETQTLESYLELDPSSITIDCATQTKNILDEILVDTETQTLLPEINFDDDFGSISCGTSMDGQTQTLPWGNFGSSETSPIDILQCSTSSVETQTVFNMQLSRSDNLKEA